MGWVYLYAYTYDVNDLKLCIQYVDICKYVMLRRCSKSWWQFISYTSSHLRLLLMKYVVCQLDYFIAIKKEGQKNFCEWSWRKKLEIKSFIMYVHTNTLSEWKKWNQIVIIRCLENSVLIHTYGSKNEYYEKNAIYL